MKFRDVERYIRSGSYQVNMPLGYLEDWIQRSIKDCGLELNPDFQRGHVWTEAQQSAFIEFLLRGGKSNRTVYFNCPGWFNGDKGNFVCVDGLQRITAIRKFMNNEIPAFGTYYKDFEDDLPMDVDILININDLKTKKEVLTWYLQMNSGGTPHTQEELDRVRNMLKEMK